MLNKLPFAALLSAVILASGCTTHLSEGQKRELDAFDQKGLKVEEKSVATAAVLGVFPMAGYFYGGHPILAFTTLPLYPFLGPLWMPYDTAQSAKNRNYYATKEFVSARSVRLSAKSTTRWKTKRSPTSSTFASSA